jgi:hypothetical protein
MSASHLPPLIEHPDGRREVELEKGCRLQCWKAGDRWVLEVHSNELLDFVVERRINQIRWPVQ